MSTYKIAWLPCDGVGCEVMEAYWKGLPRYQRTRIRQQWQAEGRALLPFMQVKR